MLCVLKASPGPKAADVEPGLGAGSSREGGTIGRAAVFDVPAQHRVHMASLAIEASLENRHGRGKSDPPVQLRSVVSDSGCVVNACGYNCGSITSTTLLGFAAAASAWFPYPC